MVLDVMMCVDEIGEVFFCKYVWDVVDLIICFKVFGIEWFDFFLLY